MCKEKNEIDLIRKDVNCAMDIAPLYYGSHGEKSSVERFLNRFLQFRSIGQYENAFVVLNIAVCEIKHLTIIFTLLNYLGLNPTLTLQPNVNLSKRRVVDRKDMKKLILDDIGALLAGIDDYQNIIKKLKNNKVKKVISQILIEEKNHLDILKKLYEKI